MGFVRYRVAYKHILETIEKRNQITWKHIEMHLLVYPRHELKWSKMVVDIDRYLRHQHLPTIFKLQPQTSTL